MIQLHRLAHEPEPFLLNPDLLVTIETTPDTVVSLATGVKIVVAETSEEVVARVRAWRTGVLSGALNSAKHASIVRL